MAKHARSAEAQPQGRDSLDAFGDDRLSAPECLSGKAGGAPDQIAIGTPMGALSAQLGQDGQYPEIIVELDGFQLARIVYNSSDASATGDEHVSICAWTDGGYEQCWWHRISPEDVREWKEQLDG